MLTLTGPISCIRCNFKTDALMDYHDQDGVLHEHLESAHPGWMFDGAQPTVLVDPKDQRIDELEQENAALKALLVKPLY